MERAIALASYMAPGVGGWTILGVICLIYPCVRDAWRVTGWAWSTSTTS